MRDERDIEGLMLALQAGESDCRMAAAAHLAEIGLPALPRLADALREGDQHLRVWAAYTLGMLGDPLAIPGLTMALDDPDRDVARWAAAALQRIRESAGGCGCRFCR
jgi:HEAT repeat protein